MLRNVDGARDRDSQIATLASGREMFTRNLPWQFASRIVKAKVP
jgi:hypothetical protein